MADMASCSGVTTRSEEPREVLYEYDGKYYAILEWEDVHKKIQKDIKFAEWIFKKSEPCMFDPSVQEDTGSTNLASEISLSERETPMPPPRPNAPSESEGSMNSAVGSSERGTSRPPLRQAPSEKEGSMNSVVGSSERGTSRPPLRQAPSEKEDAFQWDPTTVTLLLDSYLERKRSFRDPKQKKANVWREILEEFLRKGYVGVSIDLLANKFRNLKKTFVAIKDNNNSKKRTGRGAVSWQYYDIFNEIFHDDNAVNLNRSLIIESGVPVNSTIARENEEVDEVEEVEAPPHKRIKIGCRTKKLEMYRDKQMRVEEERLGELKKIVKAVEDSNKIQLEKNTILKSILEKLSN